jgi:hypothetical protein
MHADSFQEEAQIITTSVLHISPNHTETSPSGVESSCSSYDSFTMSNSCTNAPVSGLPVQRRKPLRFPIIYTSVSRHPSIKFTSSAPKECTDNISYCTFCLSPCHSDCLSTVDLDGLFFFCPECISLSSMVDSPPQPTQEFLSPSLFCCRTPVASDTNTSVSLFETCMSPDSSLSDTSVASSSCTTWVPPIPSAVKAWSLTDFFSYS